MNKIIIGIVAVALVFSSVALFRPAQVTQIIESLGANSGTSFTSRIDLLAGAFISGFKDLDGSVPSSLLAVSTSTDSLTATEVCNNTGHRFGFSTTTLSGQVTLPSVADFESLNVCLNDVGDTKQFVLQNASSASSFNILNGASSTLVTHALTSTSTQGAPGTPFYATSSVPFLGFANLKAMRISSGTDWIIWQLDTYSR